MELTDLIDQINSVYNNIDEMTQLPNDIRVEISDILEGVMDKMDRALDEYGNSPDDIAEDEDDDEF